MGLSQSSNNKRPQINRETSQSDIESAPTIGNEESLIKCTYEIRDYNEIQIINNRYEENENEDIEIKIKIWNNNKREKLIYKKKFNKLGLNTIYFIIEKKLTNLCFIFYNCSSLKKIQFINAHTEDVTNMSLMFYACKELKYLDLCPLCLVGVIN